MLPERDDRAFLTRHVLLSTNDLDEAREGASRLWCPARIAVRRPHEPFGLCLHHAALGATALSYVASRGALFASSDSLETFYLVWVPLDGTVEHRINRQVVSSSPEQAVVYSAAHRLHFVTEGSTRQLVLRLERSALEQELARLLGRPVRRPVEFAPGLSLKEGSGPALRRLLGYLSTELDSPDAALARTRLALREVERMLLVLLLDGQQHNYWDELHGAASPATPWHVRTVEEYVRANLDKPLSVGDLAAVAGVSARTLHEVFRQHRRCAPMQWVRRLRLERAREDLSRPERRTTVTAVADQWGFMHLGRFAASYQKQFGESPSTTLQRARRP